MTVSATYVPPAEQSVGSLHVTTIDLALATNDYVTGGIDISSYVPGTIVGAVFLGVNATPDVGYVPQLCIDETKVQLYEAGADGAGLDEVGNGSSTAVTLRLAIYWV